MRKFALHWIRAIERFADRPWYAPLVGLLAGLDNFIVIVPIEALLIPSVILHPRRWLPNALLVATGSAAGSAGLAEIISRHGEDWAARFVHEAHRSSYWQDTVQFFDKHGYWAIPIISAGPLPQHPAIILAGLAHLAWPLVFGLVWAGRAAKYLFVTWSVSHASNRLARWLRHRYED